MWSQWPVAAVPAVPPPQPAVPPPLPDAPPPPPPSDNNPAAVTISNAATVAVPGASAAAGSYMTAGSGHTAVNPYEQYTAAQYAAMTPEQQYALQQHWQQWQTYQQEYAKWHAQYGEQYKREMAAAAAAAGSVSAIAPMPVAAPVIGPVAAPVAPPIPAIGPVYPSTGMSTQMPVQPGQPPSQTYYHQPHMQAPAPQIQAPTQLPSKIMAQPQMYNHPPPPPSQIYQQQSMQHHSHPPPNQWQQPPPNQWQHQPPPGRFSQMPPVNYNQQANSGDTSMYPNVLQQPLPFMQQPAQSSSVANKMKTSWTKGPQAKGTDRENRNEADQRPRWNGPTPHDGQQQQGAVRNNRWKGSESANNNNNSNQDQNKTNQFGGRRNWLNNSGNNNSGSAKNGGHRNNPFNAARSGNFGSDDVGSFRGGPNSGKSTSSGNFANEGVGSTSGPCNSGNFGGGGNFFNNGPNQQSRDDFAGDNFGNNNNNSNNNNNNNNNNYRHSVRWEPNRTHQSGGNFGSNNSNDIGVNRSNPQNFNQAQSNKQQQQEQQQQSQTQPRAADLDEASFDRLFNEWEKQFEDWKRANSNHPNRDEYNRYEEEFEKQRRRIAERREQMRRRRQMQNQSQGQQVPEELSPRTDSKRQEEMAKLEYHKRQLALGNRRLRYSERFSGEDNIVESHEHFVNLKSVSKFEEELEEHESPCVINRDDSRYYCIDSEDDVHVTPNSKDRQDPVKTRQQQEDSRASKDADDSKYYSSKAEDNETPKKAPRISNLSNYPNAESQPKSQNQTQDHKTASQKKDGEVQKISPVKRKNDGTDNTSIPCKQIKKDAVLIISLDDDDEDDVEAAANGADADDTDMKNIFRKNDGIPGLDLVAERQAVTSAEDGKSKSSDKKIPSLFDVVIDKPGTSPLICSDSDAVKNQAAASEALSAEVSKALKDPQFMSTLSQALEKGFKGKAQEKQQKSRSDNANSKKNNKTSDNNNINNNNGRALSFTEWQRKKNNQTGGHHNESSNNMPNDSPDVNYGYGPGPMGNEPGNRGDFGPDQRHGFGPNGPPFGPGGSQVMGPNFIDFGGGPNSQPGGSNFGRQGPGPGLFGPGPSNGPFGRNFGGPGGPNNSNFNGPGLNFNDRGPNFGTNFRGNGPNGPGPGPGSGGPFRPNFCCPNGHGSGPNFGPGPGPFCGPGGPNSSAPFDRNFAQGNNNNPNDRNFGPGPSSGPNHPNFNGLNHNNKNNNNHHFNENPFRRNGGFDDGPGFGPRGKGPQKNFGGQQRNKFGNSENNDNNKPWPDCPEHIGGQMRPGEPGVYRPVQVFDYQNSRNTAAKVIDYGHKSADRIGGVDGGATQVGPGTGHAALPEFRPGVTFDYGHASHSAAPIAVGSVNRNPSSSNSKKKKNRKKNKNRQGMLQQQQQQQQQPHQKPEHLPQHQQQQQQQHEKQQQEAPEPSGLPDNDTELNGQDAAVGKPNDLEDISDGEDNLVDAPRPDSQSSPPAPPPPPMLHTQFGQEQQISGKSNPQRRTLADPPAALFPTTAAANQKIVEPQLAANISGFDMIVPTNENRNTISVDEVLLPPARLTRPKRICIIIRGPPGSGKSHVARLIKEKELEMGGATPRILSIDDYFIIENDYEEKCPKSGKKIPKKEILYEYDDTREETYLQYLIKSFKKTLSTNLYDFIIVDCNNNSLRSLNEFYCYAKDSNFVPYIVDMHCDLETCLSRNSHHRSEHDIQIVLDNWCPTPLHYIKLDVSSLLENVVEMEDVENMATDDNANSETAVSLTEDGAKSMGNAVDGAEDEDSNSADAANNCGFLKSKWESETTQDNLDRLDGTKRLIEKRKTASMADYLQLDDWEPPTSSGSGNGKKRVRWADIEEKLAQKKMREIGFVVGQTDWKRMMDPNAGNRALNKTKYIERINKRR